MRKRILPCFLVPIASMLFFNTLVAAQSLPPIIAYRDSNALPTIMVVGTTHFANPGQDNINIDVEDVLSDAQQAGIIEIVNALKEFRPTHVVVEILEQRQNQLDERYQSYLDGTTDLNRSEMDQVGMRLAKAMGHNRIYGADWQGEPPGGFTADFNWYEYAQESGLEERLAAVSNPSLIHEYAMQHGRTIPEWIVALNSMDALRAFHRIYFDVALIGNSETSPGANWFGHWYTRNLMIFNNIVRLANSEDDRVLVIYGVGHAYLLRQFAIESGAFEVADLADYL